MIKNIILNVLNVTVKFILRNALEGINGFVKVLGILVINVMLVKSSLIVKIILLQTLKNLINVVKLKFVKTAIV